MRSLFSVLIASAATVTSCAGIIPAAINSASKEETPTVTMEEVKAAEARGDTAFLDGACYRKDRVSMALDVWDEACRAIIRLADRRNDHALLIAICHGKQPDWPARGTARHACDPAARFLISAFDREAAECPNVAAAFDRYHGQVPKDHKDALFIKAGVRAARCKSWDHFWGKMVHWGQREGVGYELLLAADKAGVALEAGLMQYLKANAAAPFAFEHGTWAVAHITAWLLKTGKTGGCGQYVPYARGPALGEWLGFFTRARCVEAAPLAVTLLADDRAARRHQACVLLGKIGARKHIKKLKILARTDPALRVSGGAKIYHVRDACQAAIGKIQLR